jgi:hypothetical protein
MFGGLNRATATIAGTGVADHPHNVILMRLGGTHSPEDTPKTLALYISCPVHPFYTIHVYLSSIATSDFP